MNGESEKLILRVFEEEAVSGIVSAYARAAERCGVSIARVVSVVADHYEKEDRECERGR